MKTEAFTAEVNLPVPAATVATWHRSPGAFARLTPPWEPLEVVEAPYPLEVGRRFRLRTRVATINLHWHGEITSVEPGGTFTDRQISGPFRHWQHTHRILSDGDQSILRDEITFATPVQNLGAPMVRKRLERLLRYRHAVLREDLARYFSGPPPAPQRILVTGGSGLVGSAVVPLLRTLGHEVWTLTRSPAQERQIGWDPAAGNLSAEQIEGFDAVIHLAGESIASGRWSDERKRRILTSRVDGTRLLARILAGLKRPPRVFVCASGASCYPLQTGAAYAEDGPFGNGFLARVVQAWEDAAQPAREVGIRTVHLRFGAILSPAGGALAKMLPPFRLGLGGRIGSGRQHMSWLTIDDAADLLVRALSDERLEGPVNAVAPEPVSNAAFTRTLARVLRRPAALPVPALAVRLLFGQMGEETILADNRVKPLALTALQHRWRCPNLRESLEHLLAKPCALDASR